MKESAPQPAYPEVMDTMHALYVRNRDTISKDGATDAEWREAILRDTTAMLNADNAITHPDLPQMAEEEVRAALSEFHDVAL